MPDFSCCAGRRLGVHFLHRPHRSFEEILEVSAGAMVRLLDLAGDVFDGVATDIAVGFLHKDSLTRQVTR